MITLDDIEDMCALSREEITQIADHEHISEAQAVAEIEQLMHEHGGPQKVHQMLCDDIRAALGTLEMGQSQVDRRTQVMLLRKVVD